MTRRRWSRWWVALVLPVLMGVFAVAPAYATAAPTAPTNLQVTFPGPFSASFTWGPSTGYAGPFWYEVYLNGELLDETPSTQTSTGARDLYSLSPYTVSVVANDRFGNRSAAATTQFTISRPVGPVPTTPQNLRANYVDGVLQSLTWDPSTMEDLEFSIWYVVHLSRNHGGRGTATVFRTTVTPRQLLNAIDLDPGTYTIQVVAWGHTAGVNRPSDHSNSLTVTFPDA